MNWDKVKGLIGGAAPLIGSLIGGPAGGAVGSIIGSALGVEPVPDKVEEALKSDPDALVKLKLAEQDHKERLLALTLESEANRLAEVNQTIRAELGTSDKFKSYWRPTFGYCVALSWIIQMVAIVYAAYLAIQEPENAAAIIQALGAMVGALSVQWGVALSILGISVHKRSQDKQVQAGQQPTGILGGLASLVKK